MRHDPAFLCRLLGRQLAVEGVRCDVEAGAVSFRFGDRTQINGVPRDAAVAAIVSWVGERKNATPTAELMEVSSA